MGNTSSNKKIDERNLLADFNKIYKLVKEWDDPRFGDVRWYKHKVEETHVLQKDKWSNTEKEFKAFVAQCDEKLTFSHKNLIKFITYKKGSEDNICGDFNKIILYFEYYSHDLQKEIDQRSKQKEYLTEPELWYLLLSVISAAQSLEKKKIPHGEIRPENVLLTPEGFVKIFDNSLISSQTSAYARALSGNIDSLLSPKMMASLSKKESKPRHDAHKSDVFALGLTILHAATLENSINVYDFAQLLVDYSQIQRMLLGARSKYSEFFVNFIMEMLNQDELQRPSFQNLLDILSPYESSIREMKPFIYVPQQRLGRYQQFQQPGIPQGTIITKSPMRTVSPAHVINHAIPPQISHRNNSPNFVAAPAKSPIRTPNTLKHQVFVNVSPKPTASNQFSPRGIPNNIPQHTASSTNFQFSPQNPSYSLGLNQQNTPQYGQVLQNSSVPVHISQQLGHSSGNNTAHSSYTPGYTANNQNVQHYNQNPNFSSTLTFSSHQTLSNTPATQSVSMLPGVQAQQSQISQAATQIGQSTNIPTDSSTVDISLSEIDKRVNEALKNSEETIRKHSNLAATSD